MSKMEQLNPNDEKLLYEAGYLLLTRGKISAAREIFEGLVAMTPGKALPHTFLGNTYFAELKFDDAIKSHRKAVQIEPGSALSQAHLGEALLAAKKKDEGVATLKKAQSLDPNGPAGKMAKYLLEAVDLGAL